MDNEFGLSREELEARFYAMDRKNGELSHSFIIRIEQSRRGIGVSAEATLHSFLPKTSLTF